MPHCSVLQFMTDFNLEKFIYTLKEAAWTHLLHMKICIFSWQNHKINIGKKLLILTKKTWI